MGNGAGKKAIEDEEPEPDFAAILLQKRVHNTLIQIHPPPPHHP